MRASACVRACVFCFNFLKSNKDCFKNVNLIMFAHFCILNDYVYMYVCSK